MREAVLRVFGNFLQAKAEPFGRHPFAAELRGRLADAVRREVDTIRYQVNGSPGKGGWVAVPWIGVFDKSITTSAQEGVYIVYLFAADMSGMYLSLNQGWTHYERTYRQTGGRAKLREATMAWRDVISGDLGPFSTDEIDLRSTLNRPVSYSVGHICGRYYSADSIPDIGVLRDDLHRLVEIYQRIAMLHHGRKSHEVIKTIMLSRESRPSTGDEDTYQASIARSLPTITSDGPIPRPQKTAQGSSNTWARNPGVAHEALIRAGYRCEVDPSHMTFPSARTGRQYMEAHHLIEMSAQEQYDVSLDVPANIVSLCPICHCAIHYGEEDIRRTLIDRLMGLRRDALTVAGLLKHQSSDTTLPVSKEG